jgi:TRAP-type mannitol/chloroaromatic compound transport system permease large subunit
MGINVLALPTVVDGVSLSDMFRGVIPFVFAMIICVILIILFPKIATILPETLGNF